MRLKPLSYCLVIGLSMSILFGCHARIHYPAETPSNTIIVKEHVFWFWGFSGEDSLELYDHCSQGRAYEVHVYSSLLQGAITIVTAGIYSPRTIKITCTGKLPQLALPTVEQAVSPASMPPDGGKMNEGGMSNPSGMSEDQDSMPAPARPRPFETR